MALAIAFGVTSKKKIYNTAAVLEWAVSFIFTFYILSFFIDLVPAVRRNKLTGKSQHNTQMQEEANDEEAEIYLERSRSRDSFAGRRRPETREMYAGDGSRMAPRRAPDYPNGGFVHGSEMNPSGFAPAQPGRRY